MLRERHDNALMATLTGLADQFRGRGGLEPPTEALRFDGQVCLVTGANSGLGKATAVELARRGAAKVILACRSGIPEAGVDVERLSGKRSIEMRRVDLSDLESVHAFADGLRDDGIVIDRLVLNAGVMPAASRKTAQGLELMFGVNYFANVVLTSRLLEDGVIPNTRFQKSGDRAERMPRIVFVSSEAHRSGAPIEWDRFGEPAEYGVTDGMTWYGHSKLAVCTYAKELSRQLEGEVAVHALCPGPVNSNMAREAPALVKPVLGAVMNLFFNSPAKAAEPVLLLAGAPEFEAPTGQYLHMMRKKPMDEFAEEPANGARLLGANAALRARLDPRA